MPKNYLVLSLALALLISLLISTQVSNVAAQNRDSRFPEAGVPSTNSCPNLQSEGQCVRLRSDKLWKVVSTGIPTLRLVTRPANSAPWGSVIPGIDALWLYHTDFNTGPVRSPNEVTRSSFVRNLGNGTPRYNVDRVFIRIAADNAYILYVNGYKVGWTYDETFHRYLPSADWHQYHKYDVTNAWSGQGSNEIRVDVIDNGGAAGFLLDGEVWCQRGKTCSTF